MPSEEIKLTEAVSILMPVCNEIDILPHVYDEWQKNVLCRLPEGSEIIFDDGFSVDGTFEYLTDIAQKSVQVRVIRGACKDGFGNSAKRLYREARNEWIFFTDSDGQYVAEDFWNLAPHTLHYNFIHGVKQQRSDRLHRVIVSFGFNALAKLILRTKYSDINSAFRLMRKNTIAPYLAELHCMQTLVNAELLLRVEAGKVPVKQIAIRHRHRAFGASRGLPLRRLLSELYGASRGIIQLALELRRKRKSIT